MTAPTCRWFRWSLRTLFVAITVLCVTLGWNMHQYRQLQQRVKTLEVIGLRGAQQPGGTGSGQRMPLLWRMLGTRPVEVIELPLNEFSESERQRIQALFPETSVVRRTNS